MLESKDLVEGLQFFSQDALLNLLKDIPKEELLKTVFEMFSEVEVIQYMPEKELDKLLIGTDMEKGFLLNQLQFIPEVYLQQILESVTGQEAKGSSADLVVQIGQLGNMAYKKAITNLEPEQKRQLTFLLTNSDNKLYEKFDTDAYLYMMNRERDKNDMVKSMGFIKPEHLQKMITKQEFHLSHQKKLKNKLKAHSLLDLSITKSMKNASLFIGACFFLFNKY